MSLFAIRCLSAVRKGVPVTHHSRFLSFGEYLKTDGRGENGKNTCTVMPEPTPAQGAGGIRAAWVTTGTSSVSPQSPRLSKAHMSE